MLVLSRPNYTFIRWGWRKLARGVEIFTPSTIWEII